MNEVIVGLVTYALIGGVLGVIVGLIVKFAKRQ